MFRSLGASVPFLRLPCGDSYNINQRRESKADALDHNMRSRSFSRQARKNALDIFQRSAWCLSVDDFATANGVCPALLVITTDFHFEGFCAKKSAPMGRC